MKLQWVSSLRSVAMVTGSTVKEKLLSAYSKNFKRNPIAHSIFLERTRCGNVTQLSEPNNMHSIVERLSALDASSSETNFTSNNCKRFKRAGVRAISDDTFKTYVLTVTRGDSEASSQENLLFDKLASITSGTPVSAMPDRYDGTDSSEAPRRIRRDLCRTIVLSDDEGVLLVTNIFLEVTILSRPEAVTR